MLLLIDNYDSFAHNLARYFVQLGQELVVVRNDAVDVAAVRNLRPQAIVFSPGPCAPAQAGSTLQIVRELHTEVPMLGVCLGHQTIGEALGGRVVRAEPTHGRASEIVHKGEGIFSGLPSPLRAARYHSLVVDEATLPTCLQVTARTTNGALMALAHRQYPVVGVQFHPESVLTPHGYALLAGFLRIAELEVPRELPEISEEVVQPAAAPNAPLTARRPVTF